MEGQKTYDDVWLIVPVYNEAQVLAEVLESTLRTFPHVVCVDDGSSDDSIAAILGTTAHLVRHPVNLGQGAALQTGITYALAHPTAQYFVTFDADGQHRLEDAEAMVAAAASGEADVVLGTRFADGGQGVPLAKRLILRVVARMSRSSRRLKLTDAHNGLRVFTRAPVEQLDITMNGMAHASEIVDYLSRSAWRVREVPVSIRYTEYSMSKGQSLLNGINILFDLSLRTRRR